MPILRVKLRNATIYHPEGQIKKKICFSKMFSSLISNAKLVLKVTLKDIEEKNHRFEKSGALKITILQRVIRCVAF